MEAAEVVKLNVVLVIGGMLLRMTEEMLVWVVEWLDKGLLQLPQAFWRVLRKPSIQSPFLFDIDKLFLAGLETKNG